MNPAILSSIATPYKLGRPVLSGSGIEGTYNRMAVDAPFVFYHQHQFHMLHIGYDGIGYQTALAVSDNLIHWQTKGVLLKRKNEASWDQVGAAGVWIIKENNDLMGLPTLKKIDNKYWMIYHAYPQTGYETGPAEMGLAWTEDESLLDWHRLPQPVFSWKDGADWEQAGLYKACIIEQAGTYTLFYNAKNRPDWPWTEQIGLATSTDLLHWERYAGNPILKVTPGGWDSLFSSDPYVVRAGDTWLMFYYGYDEKHAQDGLAYSTDLLHWQKVPEPILRYGQPGEIDDRHAHKPGIIVHNGVLYHFYCAVQTLPGKPGEPDGEARCITVATSQPIA